MTSRSTRFRRCRCVRARVLCRRLRSCRRRLDGGWAVDTENCSDPDRANAPIEGTIRIGSVMPLSEVPPRQRSSRRPAASRRTSTTPTRTNSCPATARADRRRRLPVRPALTPGVVNGLIDDGSTCSPEIIGTQNNLSVASTRSTRCIPLACCREIHGVGEASPSTRGRPGLLTSYEYEFGYLPRISPPTSRTRESGRTT